MARNLQFTTGYLAAEDRLLLQGTFPDETEIKLLLTRRLTRGLLKASEQLSELLVQGDHAEAEVKQQVASFTRDAAVDQADFSQSYAKGKPHPLMAEGPRLVTEISFTPQREGARVALTIKLDKGEQINFTLQANALWSLVHLVGQQAERAQWDLGFGRAQQQAPAGARGRLN